MRTSSPSGSTALSALIQRTLHLTGDAFLNTLVAGIARELGAHWVFITRALDFPTTRVAVVASSQQSSPKSFALPGTPCALVYLGQPVLIEHGVSERFEPARALACETFLGYPFFDGAGQCTGHLGLFFQTPYQPPASLEATLTLLTKRISAELLRLDTQNRLDSTRRRLDFQNRILQQAARHAPLTEVLNKLLLGIEQERPGSHCSLMQPTADGKQLNLIAAPTLPTGYTQHLRNIPIRDQAGSCGTAAFSGERVIIDDITTHPYWTRFREKVLPYGLRSCWSQPVHAADGTLEAVFAIYQEQPGTPTAEEIELIESVAALVSLVMENYRTTASLIETTRRYKLFLHTSADGIIVLNQEGEFVEISDGFLRQVGATDRAQLAGTRIWDWDAQPDETAYRERLSHCSETPVMLCTRQRRLDGTNWDAEISMAAFQDGQRTLIWASARDVSERKRMEAELLRRATYDALTGLFNRGSFMHALSAEFQRSQRHARPLAVMMLDIDHFKQINDRLGHHTGDVVLQQVASAFTDTLRQEDGVGRIGGEEFAFFLPETTAEGAAEVAERIRQRVAALDFRDLGLQEGVRCSIGYTLLEGDEPTHEALLSRADHALYAAKAGGRNRICHTQSDDEQSDDDTGR